MIPVKVSTFRLLILIVIINIIPGNLRAVGNSKLRKLLTEGPNYREVTIIHSTLWKKFISVFQEFFCQH